MRRTRRTLRQRADLSELTPGQRRELETGTGWPWDCFGNAEEMRLAWERNGDVLTREWIVENPGTRPFAAWLFDLVPEYGERQTTKYWPALAPYRDAWLTNGILHTHLCPPVQEDEAEYLDRHGLLTAMERKALGPIPTAVERHEQWLKCLRVVTASGDR